MQGSIEQVRIRHGRAEHRLHIYGGRSTRPLTKDILGPHRDEPGSGALVGSARKPYRQAHNKLAPLTSDEVHVLNEFF